MHPQSPPGAAAAIPAPSQFRTAQQNSNQGQGHRLPKPGGPHNRRPTGVVRLFAKPIRCNDYPTKRPLRNHPEKLTPQRGSQGYPLSGFFAPFCPHKKGLAAGAAKPTPGRDCRKQPPRPGARNRSVKKTCQRHVFRVGRSGYAARRALPWAAGGKKASAWQMP